MRFHRPLDAILDHPGNVRLLRFFCRKGGEWSGRRLAAELGMNPVTAHKCLRLLKESSVLDFRKVGNSYAYSLREEHELVRRCLRPLFEEETQFPQQLRTLLQREFEGRLRPAIVSLALYGSLAKGQERPASDVDLLVLVPSEAAKISISQALDRVGGTVLRLFGNSLAPYVNTVREAKQKARRGLPLFREVLASHDLLIGKPLEEVLRGRSA